MYLISGVKACGGATSAINLSRASENAAQELADSPLAVL